ncbi:hypothetical protein G7Z17_g11663 [Cylindrodendrum hubeiense]|uniref:Uncharacterized protein n=1 Tax=Cylindrodendrum hubeiense TaxID=595255 RepID=A0A9P5LA11_9HYPO|nr:hypothetical protein G7Z17_g11663 [Cylindrodendrum hubeiense]
MAQADGERNGDNGRSRIGRQAARAPGHRKRKKEAAHPTSRIKREREVASSDAFADTGTKWARADGASVWLIPGARTWPTVRIRRGVVAGRAAVERLGTNRHTVRGLYTLHRSHGIHATLQQRARGSAAQGLSEASRRLDEVTEQVTEQVSEAQEGGARTSRKRLARWL